MAVILAGEGPGGASRRVSLQHSSGCWDAAFINPQGSKAWAVTCPGHTSGRLPRELEVETRIPTDGKSNQEHEAPTNCG